MRVLYWLSLVVLVLGVAWLSARMIWPVPSTEGREIQTAIPFDPATTYGSRAADAAAAHPGQSGVLPLGDPVMALDSRLQLAGLAERSVDVMYYIWHDDISGILLMDALKRAAERGVRVRLLVDDNGIKGLDAILATMNDLPNFDVRLFNPSTIRSPKFAGYVLSPIRMNRRMHNKAFIVDGAAAIVGGRNIGDEYFAMGDVPAYLDLDVLGVGAVVADTAAIFDEYWNSAPVIELERVIDTPGDMAAFEARLAEIRAEPDAARFSPDDATPTTALAQGNAPLEWTDVQVVADDPAKGLGQVQRSGLMIARLGEILGRVETNLDMMSAYFVPGKAGTAFFSDLARQGHRVEIMTNSWLATDVPMVHAGYVKYRRDLLEAGVTLFELRELEGQPQGRDELRPSGASGASLHAKTFSIDDSRVFIGSFNFDPRSALLNCEMGFLIDSPSMAKQGRLALEGLAQRSYRPALEDGNMVWYATGPDGGELRFEHEPGLGFKDRVLVYVLNVLPIEWLL
ncbi:phospholipase D family protein [Paracoccus caeni]|uniref:Phospholipase D n=1 Tax=Paracoccus caeni TaxID=657651 RepID=A0A934VY49_9RHOB|nr:phospholipase D family protein [Paracoccus caeni]MBK4214395.1 phospholipase D family protein [Paracoccus caeni]